MALQLVIGDKNYSSWSLRAALAVDLAGADCEELRVRLFQPDSRTQLLRYSPTGKVPALLTEQGAVWDSLAIAEYLAECYPEAQLWPQERQARALARSICAEMHSGFTALRSHMPMDLARDKALAELPDEAQADIDRICSIWAGCRERYASTGNYLFGHASIADAFYAPVAARLRSYRVALPTAAAAYVETIYRWPAFQRWYQAALQEVKG